VFVNAFERNDLRAAELDTFAAKTWPSPHFFWSLRATLLSGNLFIMNNDAISIDQPEVTPTPSTPPARTARLMSLDALRGFDMFWIIGGDELIKRIAKTNHSPLMQELDRQVEHADWQGFRFEDLIFPMFIFMVGASLVFSLTRLIETHGRKAAVSRIIRRAIFMYVLGIIYYGGFSGTFEQIRLVGVLQRIAICYLVAGLIFCYFGTRGRLLWCAGLLVGYWLLMTFVPAPGGKAGDFAEGTNLANWIDKEYLPWRKWDKTHDPEGLLSTLPAIANCLIGVFAGVLLADPRRSNVHKVLYLALAGVVLAALGWAWDMQFPVIKKIWTSSFVFVACGYSLVLLAVFYLLIDMWNLKLWARPFVWIGMNPITLYMIENLVDLEKLAKRFVGGELNTYFGIYGPAVIAAVSMLIMLAIARFLYLRKIFLRL
jgi:predicted acyltransferase